MKVAAFAVASEAEDLKENRLVLAVAFAQPIHNHLQVMRLVPQLGEPARKLCYLAGENDVLTEAVGQQTSDPQVWRIIYQFGQPRTDGGLKLVPEHAGAVG